MEQISHLQVHEMSASERLQGMIARFVSGEDTSIELANEIEAAIDDAFEHDDFMQETVEMLAMYRPGGGEFLFDVPEMRQRLIETEARLRAK